MAIGLPPPPHKGRYTNKEDRPPCWICEDIGGFNPRSHTAETCFANPQAKEFRPDVRRIRLEKLARAGKQPSQRYLALGEPPSRTAVEDY